MFDFDLLQTNEDTPALFTSLISIALSFFLAALVTFTYEFTNTSVERRTSFLQNGLRYFSCENS